MPSILGAIPWPIAATLLIFILFFAEPIADSYRWLKSKIYPPEHDYSQDYAGFYLGGRTFSLPKSGAPKRTGSVRQPRQAAEPFKETVASEVRRRFDRESSRAESSRAEPKSFVSAEPEAQR